MEKKFGGKSLDEAKALAYEFFAQYGVNEHDVDFSVIEAPVKKLFGTKGEYLIKATADVDENAASVAGSAPKTSSISQAESSANNTPADFTRVIGYVENILKALGAEGFSINVSEKEDSAVLDIVGDQLGIAIGRRGETLDSLQYLAILANNRSGGGAKRVTVDCNGYREKRRESLETLASRTASKVLKQGRRVTLEPMNPYERRIIHSKVAEINGVSSSSIGEEPFRKVVISANVAKLRGGRDGRDFRDNRDNRDNRSYHNNRDNRDNRDRDNRNSRDNRSRDDRPITPGPSYKQSKGFQTSFERDYKRAPAENVEISQDTVDFEKNVGAGRIEI